MITPTVGRKVWYRPSQHDNQAMQHDQKQPLDATVVYVHSDRLVNLAILDHNGNPHTRTSVTMVQEGDPVPDGGFCEWMPYQVGKAKAHEQLALHDKHEEAKTAVAPPKAEKLAEAHVPQGAAKPAQAEKQIDAAKSHKGGGEAHGHGHGGKGHK